MFRIRRIFDDLLPANREAVRQVQEILREQLPLLSRADIEKIPNLLNDPMKHQFKSILYVAEGFRGNVKGFALLSHEPKLNFCYLDYISAAKQATGGGVGGALYERIREEALSLGAIGLFFECLPDDPELSKDPEILKQNRSRFRFYEKFGARPIINTAYETPLRQGDDNPPYLVFDGLGQNEPLRLTKAKAVVRTILEQKYRHLCSKDYIDMVVDSFKEDPVVLRQYRYAKVEVSQSIAAVGRFPKIALLVNDKHAIHHVKERGYVESPVRISAILREIERTGLFEPFQPGEYPERLIRSVHETDYVDYFKRVCKTLGPMQSVYPYVFPIRNAARPPKELSVRAGYYCIDTFTPLNGNAFLAAKRGVDVALSAAERILEGFRIAYALVRPPGHHAEKHSFGGFCYFNNAAIASQYLSRYGKVAILDIDYHHGNGQQQIFYDREDVLTVSIHGHPSFAFPYFSGFEEEKGDGQGKGYNANYPLQEHVDGDRYIRTLEKALRKVHAFKPIYLVVCLGLDTAKGDPTGTWSLVARDYEAVGREIGKLMLPTLVVQEGGYKTRAIGINSKHFFVALWKSMFQQLQLWDRPRHPGT